MRNNFTSEAKSNYEIMRDQMQARFLKYSQERMIEKFHLEHDETYLYIKFTGRLYRINRGTGKTEWSEDGFQKCTGAGYNEAMSIFDVLCESKEDCRLSGSFCSLNQLKGTVQASNPGRGMFSQETAWFDGRTEELSHACESLGGKKEKVGDVSFRLYPFEFLPMILQFWNSDEEFPANLKIMWDENILDFVHYETTFFMVSHMLCRIKEIMEKEEGSF